MKQQTAPLADGRGPTGIRLVGLLAFAQSLLFLVLWLWLCASVGAATKTEPWKNPELKESSYQPTKERDPFLSGALPPAAAAVATAVETASLRLQGIVYEPGNPSAMVNNKLLYLRRPVTLETEHGAVEITATEITKEHVILKVGGQEVELRLGVPATATAVKP